MSKLADAIDHVVIGTPDLDGTRREFMELGFQVTPHAIHQKFGTDNYLVILEDAYIELLGISGRPAESRTSLDIMDPCVAAGGGVPMLALAADDMEATHLRLRSLGVDAQEPVFWSRPADTPDGPRTASFTTMFLNEPLLPGFAAFYCKHHTVGLVRHPVWQDHSNGARSLIGVTRHSDSDLQGVRRQRERLGGHQSDDGVELTFGRHRLDYCPEQKFARTEIELAIAGRVVRPERCDLSTVRGVSLTLGRD